jgi:hypothetical protein
LLQSAEKSATSILDLVDLKSPDILAEKDMKKHWQFLGAALFVFVPTGDKLAHSEPEKTKPGVATLDFKDSALNGKNSAEIGKSIKAIISNADRSRLLELTTDQSNTLALYAAWKVGQIDIKEKKSHPHWLVGFLDGRAACVIPERWEIMLIWRAARYDYRFLDGFMKAWHAGFKDMKIAATGLNEIKMPETHDVGIGLSGPLNTTITTERDSMTIKMANESVSIPREEAKEILEAHSRGSALQALSIGLSKKYIVLAVYHPIGLAYPLYCYDRRTQKLLWKVVSWGLGRTNILPGGSFYHLVDVQIHENTVTLFGEGNSDVYLESFDIKTGAVICRFSTNYWDAGD